MSRLDLQEEDYAQPISTLNNKTRNTNSSTQVYWSTKGLWHSEQKRAIKKYRTPLKAWKKLYKGNKAWNKIVIHCKTSKRIIHGCPISPILFKIFLETTDIWKQICQEMGIPVTNESQYILYFKDATWSGSWRKNLGKYNLT